MTSSPTPTASRLRALVWLLLAWPLPALVAGALGWHGIWGSGSALVDFLIPLPVAGGVLHVPSFGLATALVLQLPRATPLAAGHMRTALAGLALAGLLALLNLADVLQALRDSSPLPLRLWQDNPLGLFLLSDGLIALLFFSQRTTHTPGAPWRPNLLTLVLLAAPCAVPVAMAWPHSAHQKPFQTVQSRYGEARGDETTLVYTRLAVDAPDFRAKALAWAQDRANARDPRWLGDIEDVALLFTTRKDAAERWATDQVQLTLCLYEDGTPPQWLPGAGDCFGPHLSFADRLTQAMASSTTHEPPKLRHRHALTELCNARPPRPPHTPANAEITSDRLCASVGL